MKQQLGKLIKLNKDKTISIPTEMLKNAGIKDTAEIMASSDGTIFIRTGDADQVCDMCDSLNGKLKQVGDKKLCKVCIKQLKDSL